MPGTAQGPNDPSLIEDPVHPGSGLSLYQRVVATIGGDERAGVIVQWCAYSGDEPRAYTAHGPDATGACVLLDETAAAGSTIPVELPVDSLRAEG